MEAQRRALAKQAKLTLSEATLIECRKQTAEDFDGLPPPIPRTQQELFKRLMDPADYEQYKQEMIAECADDDSDSDGPDMDSDWNSDSDWDAREDKEKKVTRS